MLSMLVPRFGQEDKTMTSSAAFSLQFPLLSTTAKDDNSPSNYFINCPQCHQGLPGFQALKEHIDAIHPLKNEDLHEQRMNNVNLALSPITTSNAHKHSHLPSASSLSASTSTSSQMHDERGRSASPCTSDGAHACSQCSASFPNRDLLEKHELLHSPNALVSCKICHKTFANVYRLQRHMISHDESALLRKFKCTDCDKAFKFKHHLKEHIRIHSGEKPFGCNNCGKRFSHSGSYSSHMTSKKCISMGLKLNNRSIKMDKSLNVHSTTKRGFLPPALPVGSNNNNTSNSPNNNAFIPMLSKYNNYEAMNAAFLASFQNLQNPFYSIGALDPRTSALNPYSIHRLLELTSASHTMDLINKASNNHLKNETPSLHSDPEDMIEEVTEDASDEPNKLVMDLGDDEDKAIRDSQPSTSPAPIINNLTMNNGNLSTYNSIMESVNASVSNNLNLHEDRKNLEFPRQLTPDVQRSSYSPSQSEEKYDRKEESLVCSRCDKKFNHKTELTQHEKVLCGMYANHEQTVDSNATNLKYHIPMHSGSEDDGDEVNKLSSDSERKVRVRTAISEEQQLMLKEHYNFNSRPNREEFRTIAQRLQLDPRVVQVWFQNNRSRERKLNNIGYTKHPFGHQQNVRSDSASPTYSPLIEDQPLDLSLKKESLHSTPSSSPRYGTAPQQSDSPAIDEVINLSRKSSRSPTPYRSMHFYGATMSHRGEQFTRHTPSPNEAVPRYTPYILPGAASALGLVPMERLLQMTPEMARNPLMGLKSESLSPGSEKRSWKCEESRSSHEDEMHMMHLQKRQSLKQEPEIEGQFICDQCDKAFSKQSSLARHKYEHSGQRPYKCLECPKAFKHKHHLTEHKRLHSGEKPFQCCKCLKRFSHSGSYSQHMNHRYSYCKPYRD